MIAILTAVSSIQTSGSDAIELLIKRTARILDYLSEEEAATRIVAECIELQVDSRHIVKAAVLLRRFRSSL